MAPVMLEAKEVCLIEFRAVDTLLSTSDQPGTFLFVV
jgi:hypothetical protein